MNLCYLWPWDTNQRYVKHLSPASAIKFSANEREQYQMNQVFINFRFPKFLLVEVRWFNKNSLLFIKSAQEFIQILPLGTQVETHTQMDLGLRRLKELSPHWDQITCEFYGSMGLLSCRCWRDLLIILCDQWSVIFLNMI